ncbi:MAG TPA: hypothetical protein VET48_05850 [Steroidobacteraceae bacterium]|nr:hypothetical protein [Steroidobacteraceae bacterium]
MLSTLAACAGSSTRVDKPVVIDKPDAKSRLALQNAVSKSLGAAYVVLPDDALTRDSVLTIDPARVREFEGRRLQGREARAPELFRLVRGNKKEECVLIQDRTHLRMTLPDTHCKPK